MSKNITLTLPDDVLRRAELLAQRTRRPVAEILAEAVSLSLNPPSADPDPPALMTDWSNAEVLAAADAEMPEQEDARTTELLDRQQAGTLTEAERAEKAALMERYQAGLLHKAQAPREAVRRGLRAPLQP